MIVSLGIFKNKSYRFLLQDSEHLITFARLSDYNIYRIPNAKRVFGAPFEWGVCLRPNSYAETEDTEAGEPGIKIIAFENEKSRACWLTAMRLAKVSDTISHSRLIESVFFMKIIQCIIRFCSSASQHGVFECLNLILLHKIHSSQSVRIAITSTVYYVKI